MKFLGLILILSNIFFHQASASCTIIKPKAPLEFTVSMDSNSITGPEEAFLISGCDFNEFGKSLAIGMAPDLVSANGIRYNSFNGQILPFQCQLKNSRMNALEKFDSISETFQLHNRLLRSCMEAYVSSFGSYLDFTEQEDLCHIERISPTQVKLSGSLCYLPITEKAALHVQYKINPQCQNKYFLSKIVNKSFDLHGTQGFYLATEVNGKKEIISVLSLNNLRFSVEAPKESLPLAPNFGLKGIRYPNQLAIDVHPGEIAISQTGEQQVIRVDVFVDNRCSALFSSNVKTETGLTVSPCDYRIPFGAQIKLSEIGHGNKLRLLDVWYQGDVVPSRWAGKVLGYPQRKNFLLMKPDKRYRLEIDASRPDLFFRTALELASRGFTKIDLSEFDHITLGPRTYLQPLPDYSSHNNDADTPKLPTFEGIMEVSALALSDESWLQLYSKALSQLDSNIKTSQVWPPFYKQICNLDKECMSTQDHQKIEIKMKIEFSLREERNQYGNSQLIPYDHYIERSSNILSSFKENLPEQARISCSSM